MVKIGYPRPRPGNRTPPPSRRRAAPCLPRSPQLRCPPRAPAPAGLGLAASSAAPPPLVSWPCMARCAARIMLRWRQGATRRAGRGTDVCGAVGWAGCAARDDAAVRVRAPRNTGESVRRADQLLPPLRRLPDHASLSLRHHLLRHSAFHAGHPPLRVRRGRRESADGGAAGGAARVRAGAECRASPRRSLPVRLRFPPPPPPPPPAATSSARTCLPRPAPPAPAECPAL